MKNKRFWILALLTIVALPLMANEHAAPSYPNFGLPRVEEMMFLVLQIGVILFAAKIGGSIASLLKMPSILGELGAGILIGPWALGGIGFGNGLFQHGLFHGAALKAINAASSGAATEMFGTIAGNHVMFDAASPALYGIATLASIILLFLSGLETNLKMFLRYSFVGSMVGVGGVVFSFVLGDWCAVQFLPMFFKNVAWIQELGNMPLSQAMMQAGPLYMGIMSTATSVGITARILSERKKMDSEEGTTIMAGAVIDDVLGLIVLAVGNGIIMANMKGAESGASASVNWGEIGMVAVKAFGVWLGGTLIGVIFARKISWLLKLVKDPKVIGTLAFGLSMIVAGFFESMGLAMIIGAYVMGLSLSRTDLKHVIQENLEPVYTFLVPIFFCVMGMMVDVSALCSKEVLYFGLIYTGLAVFAKVLGCAIPSMCCGFNFLGAMRIGAGMVPRGEVALIIAGLGLSLGYLTPEIFGIGILMTLITTVVAPPALVGLFIPKAKGVRNPKQSMEGSRAVKFEMPTAEIADLMVTNLMKQFRREGFFTFLLNADENIWHVAMDDYEFGLVRKGTTIEVECTPEEEIFIATAIIEVTSELNTMAHDLSRPLKNGQFEAIIKDSASNPVLKASSTMLHYARQFVMIPDFTATDTMDTFRKLVDRLVETGHIKSENKEKVIESIRHREESMSTGIDNGIAVPHGRSDAVEGLVGAIALVKDENGIPGYETIDNSPVRIVVLTISSESGSSPHLQTLAHITRKLRDEATRQQLLACKDAGEMLRVIAKS